MPPVTIYHNPRCTKSRETLRLLRDAGIQPTVIEYLKAPPDAATLGGLLAKLGLRPAQLLRRGEPIYKELGLGEKLADDDALIRAMVEHPVLIERPIVVVGQQARLGRPPERVKEII